MVRHEILPKSEGKKKVKRTKKKDSSMSEKLSQSLLGGG